MTKQIMLKMWIIVILLREVESQTLYSKVSSHMYKFVLDALSKHAGNLHDVKYELSQCLSPTIQLCTLDRFEKKRDIRRVTHYFSNSLLCGVIAFNGHHIVEHSWVINTYKNHGLHLFFSYFNLPVISSECDDI